uniref:Uncharacterized protein n=1 Tax=Plectus sambesii TaxID=2011161 RepID=A0A914VWR3_9BILA
MAKIFETNGDYLNAASSGSLPRANSSSAVANKLYH